jgi:hypothetical protein
VEREHACRLTAYSAPAALRNDKINYKVHEALAGESAGATGRRPQGSRDAPLSIRGLGSDNQLDASLAALADEATAGYEARTG